MKPTYAIENIDTQQIDPSPFQKRKHFVKEKLQDLAASIENDDPVNRVNIRQISPGSLKKIRKEIWQ
jgi:ParB-like chromosome segregation protein Spo0J